jgi:hypothetical protein
MDHMKRQKGIKIKKYIQKKAPKNGALKCGLDGTRTRDPLRDRQVF